MRKNQIIAAFRAAFPYTLPILAGYWFLGLTYGVLMQKNGFSWIWPTLMAMWIYSGSVEFLAVNLLLSAFNPVQAFFIALMVGARHLFYGITMLDRYGHTGWKKPFLIYMMSDETFSVNYTAPVPEGIDRGWLMLWISELDFFYWSSGACMGALLGNLITFSTKGLDFVMTAMFVCIFTEQWLKDRSHFSAIAGIAISALSLLLFGSEYFVIPSMVGMLAVFALVRPRFDKEGGK